MGNQERRTTTDHPVYTADPGNLELPSQQGRSRDPHETERRVRETHDVKYNRAGERIAERRQREVRVQRDPRRGVLARAAVWLGRLLVGVFCGWLSFVIVPWAVESGMRWTAYGAGALVALWLVVGGFDLLASDS